MQQSNGYIIGFSVALTIVCGGLLAGVYSGLKSEHKRQEDNDKRTQILSAYERIAPGTPIETFFNKHIKGLVVDTKGEIKSESLEEAFDIDINKEMKKDESVRRLPIFRYVSDVDTTKYYAYIIPVYGNGLWDKIWGYVAISGDDFNTIRGAVFDHKAETPGLGARITESEEEVGPTAFRLRFIGKKIFGENGDVKSIKVVKGEKNKGLEKEDHKVDGLSGASMTTTGVNTMLENYFKYYSPFLISQKSALSQGGASSSKLDLRNSL